MIYFKTIKDIICKIKYVLPENTRRKSLGLIILIVIGSFLETLGISAILPFITAILTPEELMTKWYVRVLTNIFNISNENTIIMLGLCIILIYFIKNMFLYISVIIQAMYRSRVQKQMSTRMLASYMKRDYEYYVNINTAEFTRAIGMDVNGVYNLLDNGFRFMGELFTAILISVFIIYTDMMMALGLIVICGLCFLLLTIGLKKQTKILSEKKRIAEGVRSKSALQAITGFKEIKVTGTEEHFINIYNDAYEKQRIAEVKNEYISNIPEKLIEFVCVAALIGIICVKIYIGTDMTQFIPKLAVFAVAAFRLLPSVSRMTRYMNGVIYNKVFLENTYNHFKEIDEYGEVQKAAKKLTQNKVFERDILVNNISWTYKNTTKKILNQLSLEIKKGEAIGIVGGSGAGKTTLIDVLLGLLNPSTGEIMIDSNNIFSILDQWKEMVAYVPQSLFLLDGTIRENVAFGCDEEVIDDDKIWKALKDAQMEEFVRKLPLGIYTQVGERGIKFSGGQRQRIAIARALYKDPEVIVLDEATSALDGETEKAVMEAIEFLQGKKTLIIVAHRLTTIEKCDKVYEIAEGKAVLKAHK